MKTTEKSPPVKSGKPVASPAISPAIAAKLEATKRKKKTKDFSLLLEFTAEEGEYLEALASAWKVSEGEVFLRLLAERAANMNKVLFFIDRDEGLLVQEFCDAADVDPDLYVTNLLNGMIENSITILTPGLEGIACDLIEAFIYKDDHEREAAREKLRAIVLRERERRAFASAKGGDQ